MGPCWLVKATLGLRLADLEKRLLQASELEASVQVSFAPPALCLYHLSRPPLLPFLTPPLLYHFPNCSLPLYLLPSCSHYYAHSCSPLSVSSPFSYCTLSPQPFPACQLSAIIVLLPPGSKSINRCRRHDNFW
ncbi:unnamed protein product [Protopolystoma xenopodis]|uniref:Uncharacterized protein n=1 Tax=Protopolystoma xenopodis TaxID=117903 RepID=A0A3S5FGC0_9PLAT|nr:unnamed protein product [Protopolystoma xenopodis]